MNWTEKNIKELAAAGKIKGYVVTNTKSGSTGPAKKIPARQSKGKTWLDLNLRYWCLERSLELDKEHQFDDKRKWRFDYAIISEKIAVEYEGIFTAGKSRHTTVTGYNGDTEKYNRAAVLGWKVIRVTAKNYKTVLQQLNDIRQ